MLTEIQPTALQVSTPKTWDTATTSVQIGDYARNMNTITTDDLQNYLTKLQSNNTLSDTKGFGYTDGKKYYRVYRTFNNQKTVISFVDKRNGTIYKPNSWKSASQIVLGNVKD